MWGDQCQNLQNHLHGEILHTNDTLSLICTVKFYIQMILSHLHGEVLYIQMRSYRYIKMRHREFCIGGGVISAKTSSSFYLVLK